MVVPLFLRKTSLREGVRHDLLDEPKLYFTEVKKIKIDRLLLLPTLWEYAFTTLP